MLLTSLHFRLFLDFLLRYRFHAHVSQRFVSHFINGPGLREIIGFLQCFHRFYCITAIDAIDVVFEKSGLLEALLHLYDHIASISFRVHYTAAISPGLALCRADGFSRLVIRYAGSRKSFVLLK